MINRRRFSALATASALLPGFATRSARAQSWPDRPVRSIVPFAAGGPTDAIARIVGEGLSKIGISRLSSKTGAARAATLHSKPPPNPIPTVTRC
jgi:tripartite-type tricarboxylate transporter receptor subunit TctC